VRKLIIVFAIVVFAGLFAACGTKTTSEKQREQAVNQRADTFGRALGQVPTPNVTNFPRRKTLADAVVRQSLPNHPWYVYVLGQNGNIVNYFVAKSVPTNDCDYLSSTDNIQQVRGDNWDLPAPSLEGIYQSQTGCNTLTFFDLATDAEIQVSGLQTFVTDRPLKVDAEAVKVRGSK
jgi:hypothetical protein